MELTKISDIKDMFGISTRTLRYYEEIGIIESTKMIGYAYRTYDTKAIKRINNIILLRKLRFSLKDIKEILNNKELFNIINILNNNLDELSLEISALSAIRDILKNILEEITKHTSISLENILLTDNSIIEIIDSLSFTKTNFKENIIMEQVKKGEQLKNVRTIHLPPCTVVSYHFIGENPESAVGDVVAKFLLDVDLYTLKPDARMFGFNHPNPSPDQEFYGYEDWVTIPHDLEVPAPLVKKEFPGGLYAVHTIDFGNFHEWSLLHEWIKTSDEYEANYAKEGAPNTSGSGCMEEHLNWVYANHLGWDTPGSGAGQLDLYLPIKLK